MEASSPLAAMQPQSLSFGSHHHHHHGAQHWNHSSLDSRLSVFGNSNSNNNFNFKDLSMKPNHTDYFNLRPSRGASPTASLAIDLSRNFHIDRSPQPPTPRRSLFSSLGCSFEVITPPSVPIPSPSDTMDISPLPHKAPYSTTITIQAATPLETPSEPVSILSSPVVIPESPLISLKAPTLNERRRPTISRPTLSRIKGLTTSNVPTTKSAGLEIPPPFKFGTLPFLHPTQQSNLTDECFVESPEDASFPSPFRSSMGPPRPKSSHQKTNPFYQPINNGSSPIACSIKKPSAPLQRPRKQFRRSLSMFEHPIDVLNQQKQEQKAECSGNLTSVMDLDEAPQLQLPHFLPQDDTIPRITKETMIEILDGKYNSCYDDSMIIDCRFEYEYKGGHINGAINFNDKEELAAKLFDRPLSQRTLLVFHCEYSAHRAPIAAKYIRGEDRATNAHQYPRLTYPEVYILDGGYSAFFKEHKPRCFPQEYVEMLDKEHVTACERGLGKIKQQRAKLSRAATFAFGSLNQMQESPTAAPRSSTISMDISMDICMDDSPIVKRATSRRMASF